MTWTWNDNSSDEDGFAIDKTNGTDTSVNANTKTVTWSSLSANTQYSIRVAAYNENGTSSYVGPTYWYTTIQTPTGLTDFGSTETTMTMTVTGTLTNLGVGSAAVQYTNKTNGDEVWSIKIPDECTYEYALSDKILVYGYKDTVVAVSANTGKNIWQYQSLSGNISSVHYSKDARDRTIFTTDSGYFVALDINTSDLLWRMKSPLVYP